MLPSSPLDPALIAVWTDVTYPTTPVHCFLSPASSRHSSAQAPALLISCLLCPQTVSRETGFGTALCDPLNPKTWPGPGKRGQKPGCKQILGKNGISGGYNHFCSGQVTTAKSEVIMFGGHNQDIDWCVCCCHELLWQRRLHWGACAATHWQYTPAELSLATCLIPSTAATSPP
jgi:hypothetical protein